MKLCKRSFLRIKHKKNVWVLFNGLTIKRGRGDYNPLNHEKKIIKGKYSQKKWQVPLALGRNI